MNSLNFSLNLEFLSFSSGSLKIFFNDSYNISLKLTIYPAKSWHFMFFFNLLSLCCRVSSLLSLDPEQQPKLFGKKIAVHIQKSSNCLNGRDIEIGIMDMRNRFNNLTCNEGKENLPINQHSGPLDGYKIKWWTLQKYQDLVQELRKLNKMKVRLVVIDTFGLLAKKVKLVVSKNQGRTKMLLVSALILGKVQ